MPESYSRTPAFEACLEVLLSPQVEGGYVNDPRDPGGETNMGISKRAYPELDILGLTREQAAYIYYHDYWLPTSCDAYHVSVALMVFDAAVNMGRKPSVKLLQRALGLPEDGIVGRRTLAAAAVANPATLVRTLKALRLQYYRKLRTWKYFGNGWTNRVNFVASSAKRLILQEVA